MLKVKIEDFPGGKDVSRAIKILPNSMFKDGDGDIHLRTADGCIMFKEDQMTPYTDDDLADIDVHPWFREVVEVKGSIKVKVKAAK